MRITRDCARDHGVIGPLLVKLGSDFAQYPELLTNTATTSLDNIKENLINKSAECKALNVTTPHKPNPASTKYDDEDGDDTELRRVFGSGSSSNSNSNEENPKYIADLMRWKSAEV